MPLREIIWALVALLFAYAAFELYRGWRLGRAASSTPGAVAAATTPSPAAVKTEAPRSFPGYDAPGPSGSAKAAQSANETAASPAARPEAFQTELELRQLRRDVVRLQEEAAEHRRELAEVSATVRSLKEQLESKLVSQNISPEYGTALVFARRGLDVEAIAERCGISVAEAELVCALAKRGGEAGENP